MNQSVIAAAAIFISWFVFRKSLNRKNIGNNTTSSTSESTSSFASDLTGKYEVFLSFRGTDTRHKFTDFLYTFLKGAGIHTFKDDNELRIGEKIGDELLKAIENSKISIPIFSKNYADSKWCLIEVVLMVKCQRANKVQKIYPIFYDVDVSDVKDQKGSYEKAFQQHEKDYSEETVKEWREALEFVGKVKGYELIKETNGLEGELVKKVVRNVVLALKKNYTHVPDDLVGMDHHVQEMTRLLQLDYDGVRIIGIHGMGGIGKTTIAKVIYNKLCNSFDCCCFLEDVREKAKRHHDGLVDLQKQLVSAILDTDLPSIVDVNGGFEKIKNAVHGSKVLIVLDDVDEKVQFDKLAGQCSWFDKSSRIIVTTRNKGFLDVLEATHRKKGLVEAYRSYEPDIMSIDHSIQLFSKYAFMRDSPPEDYLKLSKEVVSIAAGLPLVLVTLGSMFIATEAKDLWEEILRKLQRIPLENVTDKLRISYKALDSEQKQIFLDIACLFTGKDKEKPYYMWDDCELYPKSGINTLILRSLVKVGDDNRMRMHDQLRDLGREIVREENFDNPEKCSRVWHPHKALDALKGGLGTNNVKALNLDLRAVKEDVCEELRLVGEVYDQLKTEGEDLYIRRFRGQDFSQLSKLQFLRLGCVSLDGDFKQVFSDLRWLKWRCCGKFIPVNLYLRNLVILDLSNSTITDEWEGWNLLKAAKKLKRLKLSGCMGLIRGPSRELCEAGAGLASLNSLEHLDMRWCESMEKVPNLSNLRKLKRLDLSNCKQLNEIEGLRGLVSLEILDIKSCTSIERLQDLSELRMLKQLILNDCTNLREVVGLECLQSLEFLDMKWCESIERLPDLSNLQKLNKLSLTGCGMVQYFS